jgi:glycosyltransferase involved in cell wall biosynthesis
MAIGYREKNSDIKNLKIFKNAKNFGYGGSQKLAYAYAIKQGYDMVVMLHGDAQYAPEKLPVMIEKMEKDKSIDLLFGSRMTGDPLKGGMPLHRYWGNKILTWFQNILLGTKISEFHSGYRIFRTSSLKKIPFHLCDSYYHFDTEIIIQFLNKGLKIDEVTIDTYYGTEKCYVNIWKYAMHVAIVTTCYFLYKMGLRNIPKYKLYNKNLEANIDKIFEEFKTEVH